MNYVTGMNGDPQWSLCVTCGAWLAIQVWEHFTYIDIMEKENLQHLSQRLLPILRGLIHFYLGIHMFIKIFIN